MMILLLGYLASLLSTFVISAAVLSVTLNVMPPKKASGYAYQSHVAQVSKREKHRGNSRAARATARGKSKSVADARRLPVMAGKEVEKP
jgi:hypothetical protein